MAFAFACWWYNYLFIDKMKNYKVTYKFEIVTEAKTLPHDGFSCITFENIGETTAFIDGLAEVPPESKKVRIFNEDPNVTINNDFNVSFEIPADNYYATKKLLVTYAYYKEVSL